MPPLKMISLEELEAMVTSLIKKSIDEASLQVKERGSETSSQELGGENVSNPKGGPSNLGNNKVAMHIFIIELVIF